MRELLRERRVDEWTEMIGLRRAIQALVFRCVIAFPFIAVIIWLIAPVMNKVVFSWKIIALPCIAIGHFIGRRLTEIAGMASWLVAAIGVSMVVATVVGSATLAMQFRPMANWGKFITLTIAVFAAGWLLKLAFDDD